MLERKLVTLACAAGILATGACFLPPLPDRKPPAPPIALDLLGVKTIGVSVVDKSSGQHISSSGVASAIELRLATDGRRANLSAFPAEDGKEHDALLEVTILSVSAAPGADPAGSGIVWDLNVNVSAVLTKTGGSVIWHEDDPLYHVRHRTRQEPEETMWKDDPIVQRQLSQGVANRLVFRLLNTR